MKLYKFTFEVPERRAEVEAFYLAEDDRDFLENCIRWAWESKEATKPGDNASIEEWRDYHEQRSSYHRFMATALVERRFNNEVEELRASWESYEISEAEIEQLKQLHILGGD